MFNLFQAITEYVYELLQSDDVGLKKLEIPQEKGYSTSSFQKQVQSGPILVCSIAHFVQY